MKKENLTEADLAAAKASEELAKKAEAEKAAAKASEELAKKAEAEKAAAAKPAEKAADKAAPKPAKADDFKAVFESNPQADEIFVVGGMPFLEFVHALNHARGDKNSVKTVKR